MVCIITSPYDRPLYNTSVYTRASSSVSRRGEEIDKLEQRPRNLGGIFITDTPLFLAIDTLRDPPRSISYYLGQIIVLIEQQQALKVAKVCPKIPDPTTIDWRQSPTTISDPRKRWNIVDRNYRLAGSKSYALR
ncbi:hypothetical protein B7494_g7886 [Chlorociboria aeruginascens]|nr:hypothetical protein B7494_g7886 [Chlorociboria aeruginascens]